MRIRVSRRRGAPGGSSCAPAPPRARPPRPRLERPVLGAACLLGAAAGLAAAASPAVAQDPPDTVRIQEPGLHPEGVEWDAERGRFLVSSVTRGTVTAVEDDGTRRILVEGEGLPGSIGVHIDGRSGRLLVAGADPGVFQDTSNRGVARLGIYELESGRRLHRVELGPLAPEGRHFANDVTVGPDGTAYVTDTFSPVIYRVTPGGEASVLVRDPALARLNGIDHHPDGYLLVAVTGERAVYRIPLDAPADLRRVELSEPVVADGLILRPDGALVAVASTGRQEGPRSEVLLLRSEDGWESARVAARAPAAGATTAALRDGGVYVVDPHFEGLGGPEPVPSFEIFRVALEGAE